jgi:hypothetical protein
MKTQKMLGSIKSRLYHCFPLRLGATNLLVSIVHVIFYFVFVFSGILEPGVRTLAAGLYGLVTLNLLVLVGNTVLGGSRVARTVFSMLFVFLYIGACAYHVKTGIGLDYSLLRDNFAEAFYLDSLKLVWTTLGPSALLVMVSSAAVLVVLEVRMRLLSRQRQDRPLTPKILLSGILTMLFVSSVLPAQDEATVFFQSAYRYYRDSSMITAQAKGIHSVVKTLEPGLEDPGAPGTNAAGKKERPNIFIVIMESFNANFAESRSPEGVEYTPVFNSRIKEGLYQEHYFANSIQTAKGHFAILFSVVPSMQGKVYVHFAKNHFYSLPRVLADNGYDTIFCKANKNLDFDNTRNFLSVNGFKRVETIASYMKEGDRENVWGWGLQDDIFYRRFFEFLDGYREDAGENPKPVFATLATISNHPKFDMVPRSKRLLYPKQTTPEQVFANSIHLADKFLQSFFDEIDKRPWLEGSIVIITGDHSYPVGEHGMYSCEESFYNEFFRVPFLLIWKDHVEPSRVGDAAYSHMDIAPTLVDLLDLRVEKHHFEGVSMFNPADRIHPVYIIQPYTGKYLTVLEWPYKYTKHLSRDKEYLFDLAGDPREKVNLASRPEHKAKLKEMRPKIEFIYMNQYLIKTDNIWPEHLRGAP